MGFRVIAASGNHLALLLVPLVLISLVPVAQAELLLRNSTTIAGRYGVAGSVDGAASTATLAGPACIAPFGSDGGLIVGDNELIRYVKDETVTTWFGLPGVVGLRNGNKSIARVNSPTSMFYTADDGYLYFSEPKNNGIRRLNATHIESFVGSDSGAGGFVDATGSDARFLSPTSLAYSPIDDAWYVTDSANSALRRVTRGGVVTTVATASLNAPFYATSTGYGVLYVLNRPTSSSVGVVVYFVGNGSYFQWIANTGSAHVAIGFDVVYQRLFAASQNRVHELLTNNASIVTVAGIGTAYLDGANPRFNFINGIYVSSYRNIYLSCGPQAYVVRRLFFDPPPPLPVLLQFSAPHIFPIDNITALNATLVVLTSVVNSILGTNGTTTVDATLTYDPVMRTTNVTVRVPNTTFTNTSQSTLQAGDYTPVFASLDAYYALTNFSVSLDPLRFPFLLAGDASAVDTTRQLLEAEVRAVLQYPYLFSPVPTWKLNVTDGGNYSTWKLLLPASFQNGTTQQLLFGLPHADIHAFAESLYATDVFVNLSATFQLPYANATAMRDIRLLLQAEVEALLKYAPAGVDSLVQDLGGNTSARVYVPTSFSASTNETTRTLLGNATWSSISTYLSGYYSHVHDVVFDATKFPWSNASAVEAIRMLIKAELNRLLVGSSTKTDVDVVLEPVVNATERTVRFSALVPMALEASLNVSGVVASATFQSVYSYLEAYYRVSSAMYRVRRPALGLPVFNATWMELLRLAVGDDLAILMAFADVGANSSVPTYAAASYTNQSTAAMLTASDTVEFPLLLPPWLVNASATNATLATAVFSLLDAAIARIMVQNLSVVVDSARLPLSNATAMETLRRLLTLELRRIANTTSPSLNVMPAVTIANTTKTRFDITVPVGALNDVNLTSIVELFLLALEADGGPLASFVDAYYPSGLAVSLPYDITPWSNETTMDEVEQYLLRDVRNALSGIASSSDAFFINTTTVSKAQRTVTFGLLIPPVFAGANLSATNSALNAAALSTTKAFLLDYFPKNISLMLDAQYLPWSDPAAMAAITILLADYLADSVFRYDNVGINGTAAYNATTSLLQFKVIVPPSFDNATTRQLLSGTYNASLIANLSSYLASYFATGYSATFAAGTLPTGNATAMEDIRKLVLLDLQGTLQYANIGVKPFADVVDNNTGTSFTSFPLLLPPSFDNSTTVNLLITAGYTRVQAYLAVYYATPVPATPAPQFVYTSSWSVDSMPTANETQMELLGQALAQDVTNTLKIPVNVSSWQLSGDGIFAQYLISMATFANNATTGVLLQDINNYPIFQALLAAFTQGNFVSIGAITSTVDEGCSRGCVIGVAAVGAVVVTVGVIGAVVATSKKRRTATVVAPKFSSVMEDGPEEGAKNPLEMA